MIPPRSREVGDGSQAANILWSTYPEMAKFFADGGHMPSSSIRQQAALQFVEWIRTGKSRYESDLANLPATDENCVRLLRLSCSSMVAKSKDGASPMIRLVASLGSDWLKHLVTQFTPDASTISACSAFLEHGEIPEKLWYLNAEKFMKENQTPFPSLKQAPAVGIHRFANGVSEHLSASGKVVAAEVVANTHEVPLTQYYLMAADALMAENRSDFASLVEAAGLPTSGQYPSRITPEGMEIWDRVVDAYKSYIESLDGRVYQWCATVALVLRFADKEGKTPFVTREFFVEEQKKERAVLEWFRKQEDVWKVFLADVTGQLQGPQGGQEPVLERGKKFQDLQLANIETMGGDYILSYLTGVEGMRNATGRLVLEILDHYKPDKQQKTDSRRVAPKVRFVLSASQSAVVTVNKSPKTNEPVILIFRKIHIVEENASQIVERSTEANAYAAIKKAAEMWIKDNKLPGWSGAKG